MAMMVATPENLNEFAELLGKRINSGNSDYIDIDSYYDRSVDGLGGVTHSYIVVDKNVDVTTMSLQFGRCGRTKIRNQDRYKFDGSGDVSNGHSTGWHQVWKLPVSDKKPLIKPVLSSTTPSYIKGSKAYYEFTVEGYDTFFEFAFDDEFNTGYVDHETNAVPIRHILASTCGICLVKDGKLVSNYAPLKVTYQDCRGDIIHKGIGRSKKYPGWNPGRELVLIPNA